MKSLINTLVNKTARRAILKRVLVALRGQVARAPSLPAAATHGGEPRALALVGLAQELEELLGLHAHVERRAGVAVGVDPGEDLVVRPAQRGRIATR